MTSAVGQRRVADIMTRDPITIRDISRLNEAMRTIREARVTGLPVIDEAGRVVGVISQTDLLAVACRGTDETFGYQRTPVRDVMVWPAITIGSWAPVGAAAKLLLEYRVHRLVVVDEEQRPVGILSTTDFVRLAADCAGSGA